MGARFYYVSNIEVQIFRNPQKLVYYRALQGARSFIGEKVQKPDFPQVTSSDFFKAIFTLSPIPCLIFGAKGILDCNKAAVQLLGAANKDEIVGKHPSVFSPEFQPDGLTSKEKSVVMDIVARDEGSHVFEWTHRKLSGEEFPVEVTLTTVNLGNEVALLTQWRDLSSERKAEFDLRQLLKLLKSREEYFRSIFENSPLAIIELDEELRYLSANRAYFELTGYTEEELKTLTMLDLTHPDDRAASSNAANPGELEKNPLVKFEKRYIHKSGKILYAQVSARFIRPPNGVPRFLAVISDIS